MSVKPSLYESMEGTIQEQAALIVAQQETMAELSASIAALTRENGKLRAALQSVRNLLGPLRGIDMHNANVRAAVGAAYIHAESTLNMGAGPEVPSTAPPPQAESPRHLPHCNAGGKTKLGEGICICLRELRMSTPPQAVEAQTQARCGTCGGEGSIPAHSEAPRHFADDCPDCNGTGRTGQSPAGGET